ncbi:MAG: phosphoglycerate dehydrogenase [Armatimonadota bacterium]|nr:phosphoglycerate dehydrogenase [Armatimonadota bacterium]
MTASGGPAPTASPGQPPSTTPSGDRPRVLVTEPIDPAGLALLRQVADVDLRTDLSPDALLDAVRACDALIVRSETPVTAAVIEAAPRLQVIGRAGVGVDNIDLDAATRRAVVVVNAPRASTVAAAEHTLALLLALVRHIPQADASVRAGRWERSRFVGVEVRDKVLGIVGLGQIGQEVARRARGLAMHVIAHDPYLPAEVAARLGVPLVPLDEPLARSDVVTLHVPLTEATRGMLGREAIARMKPGARLINAARGGLVDEEALLDALDRGHLAGAALDVFTQEPPRNPRLTAHPRVVLTPHLGASTAEAQAAVAVDVARQVVAVLQGGLAEHAVNAPIVPPEAAAALAPFADLADRLGRFRGGVHGGRLGRVRLVYGGELAELPTAPLQAAVLRGLLGPITEERVNLANAPLVARRWGLEIVEERRPDERDPWPALLGVEVAAEDQRRAVAGTVIRGEPHVVRVDEYWVDLLPRGYLLVCHNDDRPGMIGKVGTMLGNADVNIASMQVGRDRPRGRAIMVLGLDDPVPPDLLAELLTIPGIFDARLVALPP